MRLIGDEELDARDEFGIGLGFDLGNARGIVMMGLRVVTVLVPGEMRVHRVRAVMAVVMVIPVRVHQRRAHGADWNGKSKEGGKKPAHCEHCSGKPPECQILNHDDNFRNRAPSPEWRFTS